MKENIDVYVLHLQNSHFMFLGLDFSTKKFEEIFRFAPISYEIKNFRIYIFRFFFSEYHLKRIQKNSIKIGAKKLFCSVLMIFSFIRFR